jgi:hypothetical protein
MLKDEIKKINSFLKQQSKSTQANLLNLRPGS